MTNQLDSLHRGFYPTAPPGERAQSLTLHFVVLSFDRYSRDDVIGEVLLPVYEALDETAAAAATIDSNDRNSGAGTADGNNPSGQASAASCAVVLARDVAPRSHKVSVFAWASLKVYRAYQRRNGAKSTLRKVGRFSFCSNARLMDAVHHTDEVARSR